MNNLVLSLVLFFCLVATFTFVTQLVTLVSHALIPKSYTVKAGYIIIPSFLWAFFYYLLLTVNK